MATIKFQNGVSVRFNGTPTAADVEEVAVQLGLSESKTSGQDIISAEDDTRASGASFKATGKEDPVGALAKTAGNIPSSTINFGKSIVEFFNPLNTIRTAKGIGESISGAEQEGLKGTNLAKETLKGIPKATYQLIVPQFLRHIVSGDFQKASATIQNDPVGQIAPLVLAARMTAQATGKVAQFDQAISTLAKPVTTPGAAITRGVGNLSAQALGATTGKGASTIKVALEGKPAFTEAMRGRGTPDEVVQMAESVIENIKNARRSSYVADLKKIGEDTKAHDITPVVKEVSNQLNNFGVKVKSDGTLDFSRSSIANSGSARADVQGVYDTLRTWGSRSGDRSGIGLDLINKQLGDFYAPSGQARAFVQAVKSKVSTILDAEVSGYKTMTSKYSKASELLDDIKSATAVGSKAKADTIFTKLTTAMKGDKEFRLEVLKQMEAAGEPTLMDKIAGVNLQSYIPSGLIGRGVDVGAAFQIINGIFNAKFIPLILATSPRIVGEFVQALGYSASKAKTVIDAVNKLAPRSPALFLESTARQSQERERTPTPSESDQTFPQSITPKEKVNDSFRVEIGRASCRERV